MSWPPFAIIFPRMASAKHCSVLAVLLGLLLGIGFSLSAVQARTMDAAMSLQWPAHSAAKQADHHPCNDCGDRGDAARMDCAAPACTAPALAVTPQMIELARYSARAITAFPASPLQHGLNPAPDPQPPRRL